MGWILTFPSIILHPYCQSQAKTMQGFRNSRKNEARKKAAYLRHLSPFAPVCRQSTKLARTLSTVTSPAHPGHQSQSTLQTLQCLVFPLAPSMITLHLHSLIHGAAQTAKLAASPLSPTMLRSELLKSRWLRSMSAPRFYLMMWLLSGCHIRLHHPRHHLSNFLHHLFLLLSV